MEAEMMMVSFFPTMRSTPENYMPGSVPVSPGCNIFSLLRLSAVPVLQIFMPLLSVRRRGNTLVSLAQETKKR